MPADHGSRGSDRSREVDGPFSKEGLGAIDLNGAVVVCPDVCVHILGESRARRQVTDHGCLWPCFSEVEDRHALGGLGEKREVLLEARPGAALGEARRVGMWG